jgi:hypothetical protein
MIHYSIISRILKPYREPEVVLFSSALRAKEGGTFLARQVRGDPVVLGDADMALLGLALIISSVYTISRDKEGAASGRTCLYGPDT